MAELTANLRALLFDVFGTLVDWRTSIAGDLERFGAQHGIVCDWTAFVDAWRAAYAPSMERVRCGAQPWQNIDALHARSFDELAVRFGLPTLAPEDRAWIVNRWHELHPWDDVRDGLERLRARYVVGTLSNGGVALLADVARFANLRFDVIFSAEIFRHYKPDPEVYCGAVELLGLRPANVMLVAAHASDLRAAAALGLHTAFVERPTEYGPAQRNDFVPDGNFDFAVRGLSELADRLGA